MKLGHFFLNYLEQIEGLRATAFNNIFSHHCWWT